MRNLILLFGVLLFGLNSYAQENKEIIEDYLEDNYFDLSLKILPASYEEYLETGKIALNYSPSDNKRGIDDDYLPLAGNEAIMFDDLIEFAMEVAYREDGTEFYIFESKKYIQEHIDLLKKYGVSCPKCETLIDQSNFTNEFYGKVVKELYETKSSKYYDYFLEYKKLNDTQELWDQQTAVSWINKNRKRFVFHINDKKESQISLYQYIITLIKTPSIENKSAFLDFYDTFIKGNSVLEQEFINAVLEQDIIISLNSNFTEFDNSSPYKLVIYNRLLDVFNADPQFLHKQKEGRSIGRDQLLSYQAPAHISGSKYTQEMSSMVGRYLIISYIKNGLSQISGSIQFGTNHFTVTYYTYNENRIRTKEISYQGTLKNTKNKAILYADKLKNQYGTPAGSWHLNKKIDTDFLSIFKNESDLTIVRLYDKKGFPKGYFQKEPNSKWLSEFTRYWSYSKNLEAYDIDLFQSNGMFNGKSWIYFKDSKTGQKYKYTFLMKENTYDLNLTIKLSDLIPL